uniref:Uncharacterized protein n=1 Tax=Anguilla anguilla TaxID=7936 RepID=A0A0E9VA59_ANGAN
MESFHYSKIEMLKMGQKVSWRNGRDHPSGV